MIATTAGFVTQILGAAIGCSTVTGTKSVELRSMSCAK